MDDDRITYKSGSGVIAAGRIVGKITQSGTYKPFDTEALIEARLGKAGMRALNIQCWCAFVGRPELADEYIASSLTVDEVRADLATRTARSAAPEEAARPPRPFMSVDEIYALRRAKTAGIRYREVDVPTSHTGVIICRHAEVVAARNASRKTPGHTEECECPRCMPGGPLA